MDERVLGRDGPAVSAVGLGCMDMSQFYGPWDDAESTATIRRALDLGVTLFDTADMYGPYTNERLLGRALGAERERVVVATKFGNVKGPDGRVARVDGTPEYVRRACDGSLSRLGVECIDLYYQHRVDRSTPVEETWGALSELVAAGKVRHAGICEAAPSTIERAHATHPVAAVQSEYSLLTRDPERGVLATTRRLGIGFVAYSPLGRGLLTGAIRSEDDLAPDDWRRTQPRFSGDNLRHNVAIVRRVQELAARRSATVAQVAIAWVLARGDDVVAIPGTKRRARLEENVAAADLRLSDADLALLDDIAPPGAAAGDRYPDMSSVDA